MVNFKALQGKKICVAVSGGADSVALLHYLKAGEGEFGYRLSAVHCEHGIRGAESLADKAFVEELCARWSVPLFVYAEDCVRRAKEERVSLETAGRSFRYERFFELIHRGEVDYIATAHHLYDEAETVLFRLCRGSALAGVGAMREQSGVFLRPFLTWSKEEILAYIGANDLSFREDSTNLEGEATRNKLRLEILPKLEECIPGARQNLARFARLAREDDGLLQRLSEKLLVFEEEGATVLFSEEKPLFTRAALTAMKALGLNKDYQSIHLDGAFALQSLERGSILTLPQNLRAKKTEKGIYFYLEKEKENTPLGEVKPFGLGAFDGGRYLVNVQTVPFEGGNALRVDGEKIPPSAVFRFRREGDEIKRFGGGRKSLKKLFNERKTPVEERGYLPLIAEGDSGEVYAVCGVEISEKVKVDEDTKIVYYIATQRKEG